MQSLHKTPLPSNFYLFFIEFLMKVKHQIVNLSADYGLSSMQALTLLLTREDEPRPMRGFCDLFGCDPSNITGIIDGLEQRKLVSRQEHPGDRRIKVIKLEPKGVKLKAELIQRVTASSGNIFDTLSAAETKQLVAIFEKLARV